MIVGLSGAGVKGLPLASLASTTYTPNSTAGFTPWSEFIPGAATTAGTAQWFRGDPSYLEGSIWANTEPSTEGVIINASLDSTNCYLTGSSAARLLTLSWKVTGGGTNPTVRLRILAPATTTIRGMKSGTAIVPCSAATGGRSVWVEAQPARGDRETEESISIGIRDLQSPRGMELTDAEITLAPECVRGQQTPISWVRRHGQAPFRYWVNDGEVTGPNSGTFTCPGANPAKVVLFVLGADGGGIRLPRSIRTLPPGPTIRALSKTAGDATVSWGGSGVTGAVAAVVPSITGHTIGVAGSTHEQALTATQQTAKRYTFTGLDSGAKSKLRMRYKVGSEWSAWSEIEVTTDAASTTLAAPASVRLSSNPKDLSATTAKVLWSAVGAATGFDVRVGTKSGDPTTTEGQGSTEVTVADLKPGTTYTIQVRSRRGAEASAWRSSPSFTTKQSSAPDPVSNVRASARTSSSITLAWDAYAGATGYTAMWLKGAPELRELGATATSHRFTGMSANTEYNFGVQVKTSSGTSETKRFSARTCPSGAPGKPTGLSKSGISHNAATLSWTADQCATGYEVKRGSGGTVVSRTTSSYSFTGLSASTTHTLYVRALNGANRSGWSSTTATTSAAPLTAPPPPSPPTVSRTTTSSIRIYWPAAPRATGYDVRRGASGSVTAVTSRIYTFSGLSANTRYTLYVRARNSAGSSGWTSLTARTRLAAPTVSAGSITSSSARVSWTSVSGAAGYDVIVAPGNLRFSTTSRYRSLSGLTANYIYVALVRAKNGSRTSDWAWTSFTTLLPTPSLSASVTSSSMTVTWPAVSGATGYRVRYTGSGSGTSPSGTRSDARSSLRSYTNYTTQVRAVGSGNAVSAWASITRRTKLATPIVSAGTATASSVKITWTGDPGANAYDVKRSPGGSTIRLGNVAQYTFSGLNASTLYAFSVQARRTTDSSVTSDWGATTARTSAPAPTCTTPAAPTSATASAQSSTSIRMSWTRSTSSGVDGYQVQRRTAASSAWGSATTLSKTATSHTFTALARDTQYSMRIRAYDGTCMSAYATATARTDIEGRIAFRERSSGRLEVQFRIWGRSGLIAPQRRFVSPSSYPTSSEWLNTTDVIYNGAVLGKIQVRFLGSGTARRAETGFLPRGGSRILPRLRILRYQSDSVLTDRWYYSSWFSFRPTAGATGSSATGTSDGAEVMEPARDGDEPPVEPPEEEERLLEAGEG